VAGFAILTPTPSGQVSIIYGLHLMGWPAFTALVIILYLMVAKPV
jgi:hypothetical protein